MPYVQGLRWGFLCSNCWKRGELTEHEEPSKAECQLEFSLDLQGQRSGSPASCCQLLGAE